MAIGKTKRFEIFRRDGFICQYCGDRPPDVVLEVDHIQPVSKGGTDHDLNLITSCFDCNRGKRDRVLSEKIVKPDADLEFLKVQQEIAEARRFLEAEQQREECTLQIVEAIQRVWLANELTDDDVPADSVIRSWLARFSPESVVKGIRLATPKILSGRIYGGFNGILRYVSGVIYNIEQEGRS
jgi:hypothetical protein